MSMKTERIPPAALFLGIAGLIPFVFGAIISMDWFSAPMSNPPLGKLVLARYGVIILSFMSGALWTFATHAEGRRATMCYILATIPALWVFLNPGTTAATALLNLMIGFTGLLILDYMFYHWKLTPPWWISLRIQLTLAVLACLALGIWA